MSKLMGKEIFTIFRCKYFCLFTIILLFQVSFVEQQITLKRVKREIIHDKQLELPLREISNLSMFYRAPKDKIDTRGDTDLAYNDPLFGDMWYLVSIHPC